MATQEHAHPTGYKQYFTTWCWLLFMTLLALGIGYLDFIHGGLKTFLLVAITLAKIYLIGSIFMHLKSERVNLVMLKSSTSSLVAGSTLTTPGAVNEIGPLDGAP